MSEQPVSVGTLELGQKPDGIGLRGNPLRCQDEAGELGVLNDDPALLANHPGDLDDSVAIRHPRTPALFRLHSAWAT